MLIAKYGNTLAQFNNRSKKNIKELESSASAGKHSTLASIN